MYSQNSSLSNTLRQANQQVASTVENQRHSVLTSLNRTWFETVEELKAADKLREGLGAEGNPFLLPEIGSLRAETTGPEDEERIRQAAEETFKTEATRRVSKAVKCRLVEPGWRGAHQHSHIELDLSSIFAGSKDPNEYLSALGHALIEPRLLSAVSDATINKRGTMRAFDVKKEVVDSIVHSEIMPAAKTPNDGGISDYDRYVSDFKGLSPEAAESFSYQVIGDASLSSQLSFLDFDIADSTNAYEPPQNHHHGNFIAERISGVPTASTTMDGRLLLSHIDAAARKAAQSRLEHERQYTASTGKKLSEIEDPPHFSYMSAYKKFSPSQDLTDRLDRTLLSNARKLEPAPLTDLDLTDVFETQAEEMYGGLFGGMGGMSGLMDSSIDDGAAEQVDLRGMMLSLVQDSREDGATMLSDFWPKTMSEVSEY